MLFAGGSHALSTDYPRAMTYMTYSLEPKGLFGVFHDLHGDLHMTYRVSRQE